MRIHKGIQYALEKLGKSKFGFESTTVSNFKSKRHESSGNELVDYSRAPCLGADQKARGLWERDWITIGGYSKLPVTFIETRYGLGNSIRKNINVAEIPRHTPDCKLFWHAFGLSRGLLQLFLFYTF